MSRATETRSCVFCLLIVVASYALRINYLNHSTEWERVGGVYSARMFSSPCMRWSQLLQDYCAHAPSYTDTKRHLLPTNRSSELRSAHQLYRSLDWVRASRVGGVYRERMFSSPCMRWSQLLQDYCAHAPSYRDTKRHLLSTNRSSELRSAHQLSQSLDWVHLYLVSPKYFIFSEIFR